MLKLILTIIVLAWGCFVWTLCRAAGEAERSVEDDDDDN